MASVRKAPRALSVTATINFLEASLPCCSSNCVLSKRNAKAGSVVVPDFDMEMIQNADIGVAVCSANKKLCEVADMRVFDNSPESLVKKIEDIYELWK